MRRPRRPSSRSAPEPVVLQHCPPGDPCERTLILRPDGTVRISALCAEMLPVAAALAGEAPPVREG